MVSLDTAEQNITVEPCTHAKARHQNGQVWPREATGAAEDCIIRQPWVFSSMQDYGFFRSRKLGLLK